MRAYLEVIHGRYGGTSICLEPGEMCRVGRTGQADLFLADDPLLSPVHFAVACAADMCSLYDLNSANGVLVNEQRVASATLRHGDRIFAGITEFDVYLEDVDRNGADEAVVTPLRRVRDSLMGNSKKLYVLVDAARDSSLLNWLDTIGQSYIPLYQGERQEELASVAPYLLEVPADPDVLDLLLRRMWGKACSVWLSSPQPIDTLRKHFRHFLMVQDEIGQEMYFRFYDPRVLRAFLPACLPNEIEAFFGPIDHFFTEDQLAHTLLRFSHTEGELERQEFVFRTEDLRVFKALLARMKAGV